MMFVLDKYQHIWKKFDKFPDIVKKNLLNSPMKKNSKKNVNFV
jgi:hypothetical protein